MRPRIAFEIAAQFPESGARTRTHSKSFAKSNDTLSGRAS